MNIHQLKQTAGYKKVVNIIKKRDQLDQDSAEDIVEICVEELIEHVSNGDLEGAYDCIQDHLGLEPDYIDDLILPML